MYSTDPPYWHSMLCIFSFYTLLATTDAPSVPLKITWCSSRSFEPPFPTHLRWKLITGSQRLAWLLVPGFSPSFQFKMARLGVIRCRTPSSLFECWDAITGHVAKEEEKKTLKILVLWHFAEVCSLFEVFEATKVFWLLHANLEILNIHSVFSLDSGHVQDLHSILFKGERFSRLQYHFVRNENVEYGEYIANIRMQRVKQIYNSCIFSFC